MPKPKKGELQSEPICLSCIWMQSPGLKDNDGNKTCVAFYPQPIPADIKNGKNEHSEKHKLQSSDQSMFLYELCEI
jgi:hypothetical protein